MHPAAVRNTTLAMAAEQAGAPLKAMHIELAPLADDQVEIAVEACGICHSDLSMLHNHWGASQYPLVPGHEIVGRITALGSAARGLSVGQRVGLGWVSSSCQHCAQCLGGDQNLCSRNEATIVGRSGGFASHVRCQAMWAIPLPEELDPLAAGPLFCGGLTVFNPLVQFGISPLARVGIIGIGGLGHLAIQFAAKWGCHVTAFSSSADKEAEAKSLGAHDFVSSTDPEVLAALETRFDLILSTVNQELPWHAYLALLAPKGRLHVVGAVLKPLSVGVFDLLPGQKSVSASPVGGPQATRQMLEFCARHGISAQVERFKLSDANAALAHLESGRARYRIVLENDLAA